MEPRSNMFKICNQVQFGSNDIICYIVCRRSISADAAVRQRGKSFAQLIEMEDEDVLFAVTRNSSRVCMERSRHRDEPIRRLSARRITRQNHLAVTCQQSPVCAISRSPGPSFDVTRGLPGDAGVLTVACATPTRRLSHSWWLHA